MQSTDNSPTLRTTLLLLFLLLVISFWSDGFGLRILTLSDRYSVLNIIASFTILIAAGISIIFTTKKEYSGNFYFWVIVWILILVFIPTYIYLVIINGLSTTEVLRASFEYSGLLIFIVLVAYRADSSFVIRINNIVIKLASIIVVALVALSFFPDLADSILVETSQRYDRIRLGAPKGLEAVVGYAFFYVLVMCTRADLDIQKKIPYYLLFFVYSWYFIAVAMGRRTIFALFAVVIFYFFTRLNRGQKIRLLFTLPFLFALIFAIPQSENLLDLIRLSFYTAVEEYQYGEGNVGIRLFGIEYYLDLFKQSGYIGIGMGSNRLSITNAYLWGMEQFRYNPNDHGIFTVLYQFGFPAIALTIFLLFRIFRDLKIVSLCGMTDHQAIAMAINLYLYFSIIGLLAIFWKPSESLWVGIMFFMVWRMRKEALSWTDAST